MMAMFYWTYPVTLCVLYPATLLRAAVRSQSGKQPSAPTRPERANRWFFWVHIALFGTLLGTCITAIWMANQFDYGPNWRSKDYLASMIGVWLFYGVGLLPDPDSSYTMSSAQQLMWLISLVFEIAFVAPGIRSLPDRQHQHDTVVALSISEATFNVLRILLLFLSLALCWVFSRSTPKERTLNEEETQSLINGGAENGAAYGTNGQPQDKPAKKSGDAQTGNWINYLLGFKKLFPFLWPADSRPLQLQACFCFLLLLGERLVNIAVPHQLGVLVKSLAPGRLPHKELLLYVLFRWLQGGQGLIGSLRSLLWIPISQSTYRRLSTATFEHVLHLSLDFHLSKRIGEVTSALSKGSSLNTFLDGFAFRLFPMVADLVIAAVYFFISYDAFYAEIVISMTGVYVFATIYMAKFRGRMRRDMATRSRDMHAARTEALSSYETVHYSSAATAEISRFSKFMNIFQKAEFKVSFSLSLLNAVQNAVFTLGTLLVCYLNAYQISVDMQNVAKFVTLLTYLAQLQAPLNFFGTFYTMVQNNLVDAERMLELFHETPTVKDKEGAVEVTHCQGGVTFSNVTFAYDGGNTALKDVSFHLAPGSSLAVVGETGSGKSTLLKLLFRFYDVAEGQIKIDDLDIRDGRIEDIRTHLGVVPQDTVLFNETLMYNLQYSKPDATPEDVYEACRAASIHDKILQFPNGYMTVVGERGLKLSGGERQRVAIARAILKSPRILLMDEATASLDTQTESQIQASLDKVSQGRTTITIAHRLSTITRANQIIVLSNGSIVERGTHAELLQKQGQYYQMWNKQTETSSESGAE